MGDSRLSNLYEFSVDLYQDDEVSERCLELQDVYGASVNVILWLCWLHAQGVRLDRQTLAQAKNIVSGVNLRVLSALRELRAEVSTSHSFTRVQEQLIRKHMLNAELAIEKILLQRLQDLTCCLPIVGVDEEHLSLFDYLSELSVPDSGESAAFFLDRAMLQQPDVAELSA